MNSGATTERIYDAIRRRILENEFRPDERLDPAQLADVHISSVTPVREALNLLAGQGIVVSRSGGGFHVPALDEPGLKDMYGWAADLVWLALRRATRASRSFDSGPAPGPSVADRAASLFFSITCASPNPEHAYAMAALNGRLHAIRTVEAQLFEDADAELDALRAAWVEADQARFRRANQAYFRRRLREASRLVRRLYRV